MPYVSVIIPAFERPDILMLCLRSYQYQTFLDFELIVVDNGSKVPLKSIMPNIEFPFRLKWLRLDVVNARASARNLGLANSFGELVLFWDADMIADPEVIQLHVETFEANNYNCSIVGRRLLMDEKGTKFLYTNAKWYEKAKLASTGQVEADPRDEYLSTIGWNLANSDAPWRTAFTCNLSMPLELVRTHGGFDADFDGGYGYEDLDLAYRLYCDGVRFVLRYNALGYHINHAPLSGVDHNKQKIRNLRLFESKHPHAGVWL
jgi:glycosyltransferase involved in cell wall biosynthesis